MPDITMCKDNDCPKKEECHRFTAISDKIGQPYFLQTPRKGKHCVYYWPNNQIKNNESNTGIRPERIR